MVERGSEYGISKTEVHSGLMHKKEQHWNETRIVRHPNDIYTEKKYN